MRIFAFLVASLALLVSVPTYAQSCYSQSLQGSLNTVYPQSQTFTTLHTVNVPTQVVQTVNVPTQVAVQHTVQSVVQPQVFAAPAAVSQCSQSFGTQSLGAVSSCGTSAFAAPLAVPLTMGYQTYGNSFNRGFRTFNHSAFSNSFGVVNGAVVGGTGVSITAQDRRGTAVQATGVNNVRIQRGLLGRINGATADTSRRGLAGLLPF